jgi:hypothetical protein
MTRGRKPKGAGKLPEDREKPEREVRPTMEMLEQRTQAVARQMSLYPYPMARSLAERADAAWYVGILYLIGMLDEQQRTAAHDWHKLCDDFAAVLGSPKRPMALDMEKRDHTHHGTFETPAQEARYRRLASRYARGWDRLSQAGIGPLRAVKGALDDEDVNIDLLRHGLRALGKI